MWAGLNPRHSGPLLPPVEPFQQLGPQAPLRGRLRRASHSSPLDVPTSQPYLMEPETELEWKLTVGIFMKRLDFLRGNRDQRRKKYTLASQPIHSYGISIKGLPWWLCGKTNLPANAEDTAGSMPGVGGSPGEGNGNLLQYFCLENPMGREAWQATVHGITRVRHNLEIKQQQTLLKIISDIRPVWTRRLRRKRGKKR